MLAAVKPKEGPACPQFSDSLCPVSFCIYFNLFYVYSFLLCIYFILTLYLFCPSPSYSLYSIPLYSTPYLFYSVLWEGWPPPLL